MQELKYPEFQKYGTVAPVQVCIGSIVNWIFNAVNCFSLIKKLKTITVKNKRFANLLKP
jgi:hypothetical protein